MAVMFIVVFGEGLQCHSMLLLYTKDVFRKICAFAMAMLEGNIPFHQKGSFLIVLQKACAVV